MKRKPINVKCEADIESSIEIFCELATKETTKHKELTLIFPTEGLSQVFLNIAHTEWELRGISNQKNFMLNVIIEQGEEK